MRFIGKLFLPCAIAEAHAGHDVTATFFRQAARETQEHKPPLTEGPSLSEQTGLCRMRT